MINQIDKIIQEVKDQHPYKEQGNRDSYSSYNEGWSDACDFLSERIKNSFITYSGLTEIEYTEREMLLEKQRNKHRWFSQKEFDRLKQLNNKNENGK